MMIKNENILKGSGFIAKLKFPYCRTTYECIKACPENAITQGPDRLPTNMCFGIEMLPGKPEIDEEKCTGCGICVEVCPNNALEMVAV